MNIGARTVLTAEKELQYWCPNKRLRPRTPPSLYLTVHWSQAAQLSIA